MKNIVVITARSECMWVSAENFCLPQRATFPAGLAGDVRILYCRLRNDQRLRACASDVEAHARLLSTSMHDYRIVICYYRIYFCYKASCIIGLPHWLLLNTPEYMVNTKCGPASSLWGWGEPGRLDMFQYNYDAYTSDIHGGHYLVYQQNWVFIRKPVR